MLCAEVRPSREQGLKTLPFGTREGYLRRAVPGALRQFRPCPLYLSSTHLLVPVACARRATPPGLTDRRQNVFVSLAYPGRIPVDYFQCLSSSDAFSLPFGGFIGTLNFCLIPVYVLFFLFFFFQMLRCTGLCNYTLPRGLSLSCRWKELKAEAEQMEEGWSRLFALFPAWLWSNQEGDGPGCPPSA